MTLEINFEKKFGKNLSRNVNLSNYSWFNLGGTADYFFKAKDKDQLLEFLELSKKKNIKTSILGAGSNTLFRDNGFRGVIIKLGQDFSYTKLIEKNILETGAATLDRKVANFAKENELGNFEFLSCIPGSIGGAIIMNSGCYENDISKVLLSIEAIDKKSLSELRINKDDIKFLYRGTNLSNDLIITSAKFRGISKNKNEIEKKQSQLIERKKNHNPVKLRHVAVLLKI